MENYFKIFGFFCRGACGSTALPVMSWTTYSNCQHLCVSQCIHSVLPTQALQLLEPCFIKSLSNTSLNEGRPESCGSVSADQSHRHGTVLSPLSGSYRFKRPNDPWRNAFPLQTVDLLLFLLPFFLYWRDSLWFKRTRNNMNGIKKQKVFSIRK